jgi:hypothetical protein
MRSVYCAVLTIAVVLPLCSHSQTIQSPSGFLGYPLGEKFTYHHQVLDYFKYVDGQSEYVTTQMYGTTYERRELMVAYISTPENLQRLEQIRLNNLKRTGKLDGKVQENDISIIWMSYNVHGNEANSTETSMKVLHELVGSGKEKYRKWLKNLVIIMDPCLNPDGRDRYVNWFNQVGSVIPNPDINVREHHEGWTHGRSNHYLFDLNRDWVWQTQIESQQRLKLYNEWMPQVHVDFHEQGFNDTYYFAPAAQPMHELITDWQKEFQRIIGANNARYFDENGWLYFTRERFDLLYPAYGDTYPTYNGAIGMTYEMAGHSLAGLAIKTEKGDTLTLKDRIARHFTTAISTLEASYENRKNLLLEFGKYFEPKSYNLYILKSDKQDRLEVLGELLEKNDIRYLTPATSASVQASSYSSNQKASIGIAPGDLVVPQNQPKSTLVKVLFEKNTKLEDTLTYDISAWSLPYAYGVEGYETDAKIDLVEYRPILHESTSLQKKPYAYLLNWTSIRDAEFLAQAQRLGIKVNYFTKNFTYSETAFNAGTLVINRVDNEKQVRDFHTKITALAAELNRNLIPVHSGAAIDQIDLGSNKIRFMKKPKTALIAGKGISTLNFGEIWYFFEQEIKVPLDIIEREMVSRIDLDNYDVIVLAAGAYGDLSGEDSFDKIDGWIKKGGKIILFENAIDSFLGENKFSLKKMKKGDVDEDEEDPVLFPYNDSERERLKKYIQGGIIQLEIDGTHPLGYGYEQEYHTLKNRSTSYRYLEGGWNVGYISSENEVVAGFVGSETKENLNKNLIFGVEERGRGQVVYFADNPLFRAFWQNGKLFVANAVFFDN